MKEIGYDLSAHDSKSLEEVKGFAPFDAVVTMGCGDACPWMPAKRFVNWTITDPKVWREGREGGREGGRGGGIMRMRYRMIEGESIHISFCKFLIIKSQ